MKNLIQSFLFFCLLGTAPASGQVPSYNSLPSAPAVLFLDFDGHYLTGSSWNSGGELTLAPSNLNTAQITEVFNRIAEDYRPFHINITTDSARYWAAPPFQRMRVVFTITSQWYGNAGGVAMTNSFRSGENNPCFIFTALLNYNVKHIAEAGAHEAGHTLGLRHQSAYNSSCVRTSEYNSGAGNGEIGWAPIMGVGYYRNWTVWHNGPSNYGCSIMQSDLDIITSASNGFGYRKDDHGETVLQATSIALNNEVFHLNGIIERTDDRDLFKLVMDKRAQLQLQAIPYNVGSGNSGSDLDLQVQIEDAASQLLATYNPGTALSSFLDTILEAGTYYLRIDGKGNQFGSEYGSLGSYSIEGHLNNISPLPLRRLQLNGHTEAGRHLLNWIVDADEKITGQFLEVSADGRDFKLLHQPAAADRAYGYTATQPGNLYYRVRVVFENGQAYYSNIVLLRSAAVPSKPVIRNTVVTTSLEVNSTGDYQYTMVDISGRQVASGRVRSGNNLIDVSRQPAGMYLVQFRNGVEAIVERILKQ